MPLAYAMEENLPSVAALGAEIAGVDLTVDARDEMLLDLFRRGEDREGALVTYFLSGLVLWATLRQVIEWWFGDLSRAGKLLDFASGYGRVTRFLVRDVPPGRVWVSDIHAEAVRFQQERLGVHGLVSTADPAAFTSAERFDGILVSSLFTHLPEATFTGWLERLRGLLAPGGLFVFSVHDESLLALPAGSPRPPGGLIFQESSESGSLATSQYGSAWVSEAYVRSCLARLAPGASAHRIPRALGNFQDLWVVADRAGIDFSGLAGLDHSVDRCAFVPPDRLEISGWVADRATSEPVREVRAELAGAATARCRDFHPRGDADRLVSSGLQGPGAPTPVQGWMLSLTLPPGTARSAPLVLYAVDSRGRETVLWAGTAVGALLRSAEVELAAARAELAEARRENVRLGESEARLGWEVAVREDRIAAMEASRFWKLREGWFAWKRRLGLGGPP